MATKEAAGNVQKVSRMTQKRIDEIWSLLDDASGETIRLRDESSKLRVTNVRHDYIEDLIMLRDKLNQVSGLIEETIAVDA